MSPAWKMVRVLLGVSVGLWAMMKVHAVMAAGTENPGEFDHRDVFPLDRAALDRLRQMVGVEGPKKQWAEPVIAAGRRALGATPKPLKRINYEGLLNTNPSRIETVKSLRTMNDVADAFRAWQLTGGDEFAEFTRRSILAWAQTYVPTGNDVNENKLTPLVVAFTGLRESFEAGDREEVERWLGRMADLHAAETAKVTRFTNRYTKRLRFLALLGLALDRRDLLDAAGKGVRVFVRNSLRPDGTSFDLEERDTLTYHCSALEAALDTIQLTASNPETVYAWGSPAGGSVKKSVEYVVPYAMGEKERREWENTRIALDRRRAEAGIATYQPGKLFDPEYALPMLRKAARIDRSLEKVAYPAEGVLTEDAAYDRLISEVLRSGG
ncbi:MAG: alginate lyase family protein [Verrucomicrobiia bacterium]